MNAVDYVECCLDSGDVLVYVCRRFLSSLHGSCGGEGRKRGDEEREYESSIHVEGCSIQNFVLFNTDIVSVELERRRAVSFRSAVREEIESKERSNSQTKHHLEAAGSFEKCGVAATATYAAVASRSVGEGVCSWRCMKPSRKSSRNSSYVLADQDSHTDHALLHNEREMIPRTMILKQGRMLKEDGGLGSRTGRSGRLFLDRMRDACPVHAAFHMLTTFKAAIVIRLNPGTTMLTQDGTLEEDVGL